MSLQVRWEDRVIGALQRIDERSRDYAFAYSPEADRPISLSLPLRDDPFTPAESRPFFEALLPEGTVREQIARELRVATGDSFGLLAELGRDCAGALQIIAGDRMAAAPSVGRLTDRQLDTLIAELPHRPLGIASADSHLRLSLAGVQRKAVLVRDAAGSFGLPLDGMPSSHILKPEPPNGEYPGLTSNECFCMRLAARCNLPTATTELMRIAGRPCLVVERFDRDLSRWPPIRLHQEDLCQALGLTPDFKYQHEGWRLPSYAALAELLNAHSAAPGVDRLATAQSAVFNFLIGNADAHAKNISLLHVDGRVRLAPLYDLISTAAYPELSTQLALAIGDELDPAAITSIHFSDLADDLGLNERGFEDARRRLAERIDDQAATLRDQARRDGWHHPCIDEILRVIAARRERVV